MEGDGVEEREVEKSGGAGKVRRVGGVLEVVL